MNKILNIGVDIGSTTVKMIVMDKKKKILFSAYERHYSDTKKTLIDLLNKVLNEIGDTPKGRYKMGRVRGRQINRGISDKDDIIPNMNTTSFRMGMLDEIPTEEFDKYLRDYERKRREENYNKRKKN